MHLKQAWLVLVYGQRFLTQGRYFVSKGSLGTEQWTHYVSLIVQITKVGTALYFFAQNRVKKLSPCFCNFPNLRMNIMSELQLSMAAVKDINLQKSKKKKTSCTNPTFFVFKIHFPPDSMYGELSRIFHRRKFKKNAIKPWTR